MKKVILRAIFCLALVTYIGASYVGKVYFKPRPSETGHQIFMVPKDFFDSRYIKIRAIGKSNLNPRLEEASDRIFEDQLMELQAYFESEMKRGNLRIRLIQDDPEAMMEHHRYSQFYKNLEVFGGEVIYHYREGKLVGINGEYYEIKNFDTVPLITKDMAVELFKADLEKFDLVEKVEESKLIIYPKKDEDYYLAYYVVIEGEANYSMTGIIDAQIGKILLKYSNIYFDKLNIGLGIGYHWETHKISTTFSDNTYYLYDERNIRPVVQATYDYRTYDGKYYYVPRDNDNYWDSDGAVVSAHAFLGLTYDYYYLALGRYGVDGNNNIDIKATIHWYDGQDNAFWDGSKKWIYFLDPGKRNLQFAGAIDVVAHEYSHGVTQFTSNLIYLSESGALNEAFSDIMGTAVEFYWQPIGDGFNKADWLNGEDAYWSYGPNNYIRSLSNPNEKGYPCHLTQYWYLPNTYEGDWGGVHINSTIYSHAYFLLANGGTNSVSKITVNGIGIEKATKIFYRAWAHYMTSTSIFWNAANYLLWSAYDLYGSSSNEYAQTIKAMEAIGWIVK